jgi:hypothetical protein
VFTLRSPPDRVGATPVGYGAARVDPLTKRRTLPFAALLTVSAAMVLSSAWAAGAGATTPGHPPPAKELVKAAMAAAGREGSVRVTIRFVNGGTSGELIQDSARTYGSETVAIGSERVAIVLTGGSAYFTGNAQGLISYFGFPQAAAATTAGRWVAVAPTDTGFAALISGLTLSSVLKKAIPDGTLTEGKKITIDHQSTWGIIGSGSSDQSPTTLFVSTKGKNLPVEAATLSGTGEAESGATIAFSHWGEKVYAAKPSSTIPITSLTSSAAG